MYVRYNFFFWGGGGEQLFGTLGHASLICYTACKCPQICNAMFVQHMCVGLQLGHCLLFLSVCRLALQLGRVGIIGLQIGTAAWPLFCFHCRPADWHSSLAIVFFNYRPADWHCSLAVLVSLACRSALQLGHCLFLLSACRVALRLGRVGIVGLQIFTAAWPLLYNNLTHDVPFHTPPSYSPISTC